MAKINADEYFFIWGKRFINKLIVLLSWLLFMHHVIMHNIVIAKHIYVQMYIITNKLRCHITLN